MKKEIWKKIKGWNGIYKVSTFGRIKAKTRAYHYVQCGKETKRTIKGRILKCPISKYTGYRELSLNNEGKHRRCLVHQLVAEVFIPNPESKPEVNHKNGVKTDNRVENLEWVTYSEQRFHAYKTGLQKGAFGSKHGQTKLTEADIPLIRKRLEKGEIVRTIAADFETSMDSIYLIKHSKTWNHVPK